jgi:hypothetical protein
MYNTIMTVGRWSPSRPATLLLGKIDGTIDIWDFTDTRYVNALQYDTVMHTIYPCMYTAYVSSIFVYKAYGIVRYVYVYILQYVTKMYDQIKC